MKIRIVLLACLISAGLLAADRAVALTNQAKELRTLYNQLEKFKDDPQFHRVGFAPCCRFHVWMEKVKKLQKQADTKLYPELAVGAGDLFVLGLEYVRSQGRPTDTSKELEHNFQAAFTPNPSAGSGEGVVVSEDVGCRDLDVFRKYQNALGEGRYAEASHLLSAPECRTIYPKTVVKGPLDTSVLPWPDHSKSTYYKVKTKTGRVVWVNEGMIEFPNK